MSTHISSDASSDASEAKSDGRSQLLSISHVPGWFSLLDQVLFDWLLTRRQNGIEYGDILELGAYVGKSAIFLGRYLQPGEMLTVCDLFESPAMDELNNKEISSYHPLATRQEFEKNYLSFHEELPNILQAPTSSVLGDISAGSCRFVHVDASHLYDQVAGDINTARNVLRPGGVVALDDFRSPHTPGVAFATWEAVLNQGLNPICISKYKFYGTWGAPQPLQDALLTMIQRHRFCKYDVESVAGRRIVRVYMESDFAQ